MLTSLHILPVTLTLRVSKFVANMTFQQCHIEFDNECDNEFDNEFDKQGQRFRTKLLFFHLDFYFFEFVLLRQKAQKNWSFWPQGHKSTLFLTL